MINNKFHRNLGPFSLKEIAIAIDAEVVGNNEIMIENIKGLAEANSNSLTFLSNKRYTKQFDETNAKACLVAHDFQTQRQDIILLKCHEPYLAYAKAIDLFYKINKNYTIEIKPSAIIAKSAIIGQNCYIGHNVVIEDDVVIGDSSIIEAGSFIDSGVIIGKRARIDSHVSISKTIIGDDVVILAGARIGQDGFGFATANNGIHQKIYHAGIVRIGNSVEIGANTTIDRGSMQDTIIEDLVRIDNLVQIGHNVHIGKGSIVVAQVGIAGSSKIGTYCALGGQVGIAGHLTIGDKVQIVAQSGIAKNIQDGSIVAGSPSMNVRDWHRLSALFKKMLTKVL